MLIEVLIGGGLVVAGAAAARSLVRRAERESAAAPKSRETAEPRGLKVGDVLLHGSDEHWLAGMVELDEHGMALRVFRAPGAGENEWVAQLDERAKDVALLSETGEVPEGAVPESLPIDGRRLELECRGQADVRVTGEHLPRVQPRCEYTVLSEMAGRILVVIDFERAPRLALAGERVEPHMLELLPGGDADD